MTFLVMKIQRYEIINSLVLFRLFKGNVYSIFLPCNNNLNCDEIQPGPAVLVTTLGVVSVVIIWMGVLMVQLVCKTL